MEQGNQWFWAPSPHTFPLHHRFPSFIKGFVVLDRALHHFYPCKLFLRISELHCFVTAEFHHQESIQALNLLDIYQQLYWLASLPCSHRHLRIKHCSSSVPLGSLRRVHVPRSILASLYSRYDINNYNMLIKI